MSTTESNKQIPFKSKKILKNAVSKSPQTSNPNLSMLATKTPEKPPANGRARNSSVALTINQIRRAAQSKHKPQDSPIKSARKQILSVPAVSPIPKSRKAVRYPDKLPESYDMLGQFFDGLDNSIRLLKMKGSATTFTNISPKIESLTDRRFLHSHMAQLKFVLPEAIDVKKVLTYDEKRCCVIPDLHVSLNVDAITFDKKSKAESKTMSLRKVFRARLTDLYKSLPAGDEIPEGVLPEPFNYSKRIQHSASSSSTGSPLAQQQNSCSQEKKLLVPSHLSQSFTRRFSKRVLDIGSSEKLARPTQSVLEHSFGKMVSCNEPTSSLYPIRVEQTVSTDEKDTSLMKADDVDLTPAKVASTPTKFVKLASTPVKRSFTPSTVVSTPVKLTSTPAKQPFPENVASTPLKLAFTPPELASTPIRLMTATPKLQCQKRLYMSPDDDATSSPSKLIRRPSRTRSSQPRSLKFDAPTDGQEAHEAKEHLELEVSDNSNELRCESSDDDDLNNILPQSLLQSIKENERRFKEEQTPALSEAKRRHKLIQYLPKLFNVMHFLFQSISRTVMGKEELLGKILGGHFSIVDKKEVEEQLNLLLELVPDWISEKMSSSGVMLIYVNKMIATQSIRARLEEAR